MNDSTRRARSLTAPATTTTTPAKTPAAAVCPGTDSASEQHARHADLPGDGIHAALAEAVERGSVVVLALIDGTRLNGVPLGFAPPRTAAPTTCPRSLRGKHVGRSSRNGTAVLLREEAGQPPFVVRLAHVVYVRALTAPRD